jgi:hypothetical protein
MQGALFLAIGAAAGLAAGAILAQKYGGFSALTARIRSRFSASGDEEEGHQNRYHGDAYHDEEEHTILSSTEELEERVLEAYHNDPILCQRAIDIGAIDEGLVELTGWVQSTNEASHAVTVARGTPGVRTVVNRLVVRVDDHAIPLKERWMGADEAFPDGADDIAGNTSRAPRENISEPPRDD